MKRFERSLKRSLWISVGILAACGSPESSAPLRADIVSNSGEKLIYGNDDRRDIFEVGSSLQLRVADSTVALMEASSLTKSGSRYAIQGQSFGASNGLCETEPYFNQPTAAFCSGSLVGTDLILTAGHCVKTAADCASARFVFGFGVRARGETPTSAPVSEVYSCKEIVHTIMQPAGEDFAVVRLDRPVTGHAVLSLDRNSGIAAGDEIFVAGHPAGLPTKIAGGAKVRRVESEYFVANLDTYGGNSGSAVFNASTGDIEGILVRGDNDFVSQGSCLVSNRCRDDGCRGEDVTLIKQAASYIPSSDRNIPTNPPTNPPDPPLASLPALSFAANVNRSIPDNNATGLSSTVVASEAPKGRGVRIHVEITHPWRGDLVISVVSPDGVEVVLFNREKAKVANLIGTFGEDLKPVASLAELSSTQTAGVWKLKVADRARSDVGKWLKWSVEFRQK